MTPTIFLVDEDNAAFEAWTAELEFRGWRTEAIGSADAAFERLKHVALRDVGFVVIDVMLAVYDAMSTQFTLERTDSYLETGLCLLDDLVDVNPSVFPASAALLTNTITDTTLRAAKHVSGRLGVPLWLKADIQSPLDFGDRVEAAVADLAALAARADQQAEE